MSAFLYRWRTAPPFAPPTDARTFTDTGPSHPFFTEIEWMADDGISTGFQPGPTYQPAAPVTRQSMSAFLYRLVGEPLFEPNEDEPSFVDVSAGHPFFAEIEWMASTGVTNGFGDGTFRPSSPVSRQSMSAFLFRLADDVPRQDT
jgi:hypothetical protein